MKPSTPSVQWTETAPDYTKDRSEPRLYTFRPDYTWDDVPIQRYKPGTGDWAGIVRQVLIGFREATSFHLRYFEIAPGGYSSLEQHDHAHAVIVVRGEGEAIVADGVTPMGFLDTLYIAPNTAHQFLNRTDKPFGFLCIVDAVRDRPRAVDEEQLAALLANPEVSALVRRESANLQRVDEPEAMT